MKTIEEIKTGLVLKMLQSPLDWNDITSLPKDDGLRTFICQFEPEYAYWYALQVDEAPHPETRIAACKNPWWAYTYAINIDKAPHPETKTAACKDSKYAYIYAYYIDEIPSDETRTAACKDPGWDSCYKKWEGKYNEEH